MGFLLGIIIGILLFKFRGVNLGFISIDRLFKAVGWDQVAWGAA